MITISAVEGDGRDFEAAVDLLLDMHAESVGQPFNEQKANFQATDENGAFLGGLAAYSILGWMFVRYLALVPDARGSGAGRDLMRRVEAVARERGHFGIWVDTYDFQAPEFYVGLGYREFGRLPMLGEHPGRIWFYKALKEGGQ